MRHMPDHGTNRKRRILSESMLGGLFLAWLATNAWNQEPSTEYKLRVAVKSAAAHLNPDAKSPVIAQLPQGTELSSFHSDGVWFRIVVPTGKEGIVLLGYVSRLEVDILEEKVNKPADFWGTSPDEYRGIGLTLKLGGGISFFARGDIDKGAGGMFNQLSDDLLSMGMVAKNNDPRAFHSGPEAGGDLIYRLSSKFGLGFGGGYTHARAGSSLVFMERLAYAQSLWSVPALDVMNFRLQLVYDLPLLPWLGLNLHAGPAFHRISFKYSLNYSTTTTTYDYYQSAKANSLGLHGGAGLTFRINPQTVFFIEAQGRIAKFAELKGSEKLETQTPQSMALTTETAGSMYYIEGGRYPKLAFFPDSAAAGAGARKAVLDLSGISLMGGFMIRF